MPREQHIAFQCWLRKFVQDYLNFKCGNISDVKMFDINNVRFQGCSNKLEEKNVRGILKYGIYGTH